MANNLDGIRALVRQLLRDEFDVNKTMEWEDDELDIFIIAVLLDISNARPYEVKESVTLTVNSIETDVSTIEDLISVRYAEYPVGTTPNPDYRNVTRFGDTVRVVTNRRPSGDETAYLYCHKLHSVTESTSTLPPDLEKLLVIGVAAKAARSRSRTQINKMNIGGTRVSREHLTWAQVQEGKFNSGLALKTKQRITQLFPVD